MSHFFPLKLHHPFPPDSFQPGPQHPAEGPRRLHSQKGSLSWESQPQRSWGLGNISKILEDRGLGPHYWGALGTLVSVRKTRQKRFKRGSQLRAHCLVVSTPPQSSDGTQAYSGSRDGIAVQIRKVGGNKQSDAFILIPCLCYVGVQSLWSFVFAGYCPLRHLCHMLTACLFFLDSVAVDVMAEGRPSSLC